VAKERLSSAREAKEFLVSRIIEGAQREQVSLSDVERKILYFTESERMSEDMIDTSDSFDRDYDQDEYEEKVTKLVRKAAKRARKERDYAAWWNAIRRLEKGDHYILVMIHAAQLRPPHDGLRLLGTGLAVVIVPVVAIIVAATYKIDFDKYLPSKEAFGVYIWIAAVSIAIGYSLVRWAVGAEKFDILIGKILVKLSRASKDET
jgi:hypothetical protein